jgi:hypothetical protein
MSFNQRIKKWMDFGTILSYYEHKEEFLFHLKIEFLVYPSMAIGTIEFKSVDLHLNQSSAISFLNKICPLVD